VTQLNNAETFSDELIKIIQQNFYQRKRHLQVTPLHNQSKANHTRTGHTDTHTLLNAPVTFNDFDIHHLDL